MVFEHIEKLKREYTDKYVVVDDHRPELQRFHGLTGQVKTVNMSGRALVEFEGYNNIAWYDIEIDFLRVVDKPAAKADGEEKKARPAAEKKAPAPKEPSALEKARASDAKKAPAGEKQAGQMSVAEMLAAARSGKGAAPAKESPKAPAKAAAAPQKVDPKKMSVADMLAAARGGKGGGGAAAASAAPKSAEAESGDDAQNVRAAMEAARKPKESAPAAKATASAAGPAKIDPKKMSVADMLAMARGEKSGAATPAVAGNAPPVKEPAAAKPAPAKAAKAEAAPAEEAAPANGAVASKRDSIKTVDEQIAYCRQADTK